MSAPAHAAAGSQNAPRGTGACRRWLTKCPARPAPRTPRLRQAAYMPGLISALSFALFSRLASVMVLLKDRFLVFSMTCW